MGLRGEALDCLNAERLLKPLTLDELMEEIEENGDDEGYIPCWVEGVCGLYYENDTVEYTLDAAMFSKNARMISGIREIYEETYKEYGIKFRCWLKKPTDEERRAAKWEV